MSNVTTERIAYYPTKCKTIQLNVNVKCNVNVENEASFKKKKSVMLPSEAFFPEKVGSFVLFWRSRKKSQSHDFSNSWSLHITSLSN